MRRSIVKALCVVLTLAATAAVTVSAQQYPLRMKYPNLTPISTEQLAHEIGSSVVADVRSEFEFSVMHIDGAIHIDLSDRTFLDKLAAAVGGDKSRLLITYCNGVTCEKSYEAAAAARNAGFANVRVYDAGILEWARMARGRTLLFGKAVRPEDIIPESRYQAHVADAVAFEKGAAESGSVLIDVRDGQQREKTADFGLPCRFRGLSVLTEGA
jgi:rhodanese-related sulfurtransferase